MRCREESQDERGATISETKAIQFRPAVRIQQQQVKNIYVKGEKAVKRLRGHREEGADAQAPVS